MDSLLYLILCFGFLQLLLPMLSEWLENHNQDILQTGSLESVGEFSLCAWLLFSESEPAISDGKLVSGE